MSPSLTKVSRHEAYVSRNHRWFAYVSESKVQVSAGPIRRWCGNVAWISGTRFVRRTWQRTDVADDGSKVTLLGPEHVFLVFHKHARRTGIAGRHPPVQAASTPRVLGRREEVGSRLVHPEPPSRSGHLSRRSSRRSNRSPICEPKKARGSSPCRTAASRSNAVPGLRQTAEHGDHHSAMRAVCRRSPHSATPELQAADGTDIPRSLDTQSRGKAVGTLRHRDREEGRQQRVRIEQGQIGPSGNWLCEHGHSRDDPKTGSPRNRGPNRFRRRVEKGTQGAIQVLQTETRFRDSTGTLFQLHDDTKQLPISYNDGTWTHGRPHRGIRHSTSTTGSPVADSCGASRMPTPNISPDRRIRRPTAVSSARFEGFDPKTGKLPGPIWTCSARWITHHSTGDRFTDSLARCCHERNPGTPPDGNWLVVSVNWDGGGDRAPARGW